MEDSYTTLRAQAMFWRFLQTLQYPLLHLTSSHTPSASYTISIPTTISSSPGRIPLVFFRQKPRCRHSRQNRFKSKRKQAVEEKVESPKLPHQSQKLSPVILNFHSGGFTIGTPKQDVRWFGALHQSMEQREDSSTEQEKMAEEEEDVVVVSVGYRKGPEHTFPTALEDSVDAVLWIWQHGAKYGLDKDRVALSGFSCGGNLCFTVPLRLEAELKFRRRCRSSGTESTETGDGIGKIVAVIAFYPGLDYTKSREERMASNPHGVKQTVAPSLYRLFDQSYLCPRPTDKGEVTIAIDRADPLLSPSMATDEELSAAIPHHVLLFNCQLDQYLVEGEAFRERLKNIGKEVDGYVVEGEGHAWDLPIVLDKSQAAKRDKAYRYGADWLKGVIMSNI